jgi:hypothetical protein
MRISPYHIKMQVARFVDGYIHRASTTVPFKPSFDGLSAYESEVMSYLSRNVVVNLMPRLVIAEFAG